MLHIFYGRDGFSLHQALSQLREGLGAGDLLSSNTSTLEGDKLTLELLQAHCQAMPFLAPKRLVIVEGLLARFEPPRRGQRHPALSPQEKALMDGLRGCLAGMPATTELVLVDGDVGRDNPLLQALAPLARARHFPPLPPARLPGWVQSRARLGGGSISPQAAALLADLIGDDLWTLASEVEKLCLYAAGRAVEVEDVQLLVSRAREERVYALADAICDRDAPTALRLLHRLLDDGAPPAYLLFLTGRQFRLMLLARSLPGGPSAGSGQALSPQEIARRLGLPDYAAGRVAARARRFTEAGLERAHRRLLEADLAMKTGRQPGDLALDLLIADLCAPAQAGR